MDLMQYVIKAKKAINDAYCAYEEAIFKKNKAVSEIKEKAKTSDAYTNIEASEDLDRVNTAFETENNKVHDTFNNAVSDIRGALTAAVHEYYRPDGDKINEADERLLNCGIKLSNSEIIDMVVRNGDNCTMLRLIGNYIEKEKVTDLPKSIEMAIYRATKAGACEVKAFDDFVHLSSMGLGHQDGSYLHVWRRLDEYEAAAKTALDKAKPYISEEELKAVEAAEIARETNFQPFTI